MRKELFTIAKTHEPYPPEFWAKMLELVAAGRKLGQLSREFEVSAETIRNWLRQGELDSGKRSEGLTTEEKLRYGTTTREPSARAAPDLVRRDFTVSGPDQLWVADIPYVPTWAGFLYLAVVLHAWSRRVVGWAMRTDLRTELVLEVLEMGLWQGRPKAVIHHSDQGSQYTSLTFGRRCRQAGVRASMGSVGGAYDNAMCEGFFGTLECELLA